MIKGIVVSIALFTGCGTGWGVTPEQVGAYEGKATLTRFNNDTGQKTVEPGTVTIVIHEGTGFDFQYKGKTLTLVGHSAPDGHPELGQAVIGPKQGVFLSHSTDIIFSASLHFQKPGSLKGSFTSSFDVPAGVKTTTLGTFTLKKVDI